MFCGDTAEKSHLEDVFPLWLCRKLAYYSELAHPGTAPTYENYTYTKLDDFRQDLTDGGPTPGTGRLIGSKPSAYLLPEVCQECNNGWMGRLEQAARLLLTGLLDGKSKALSPHDQLTLATWTIKTALTYDAARDPRHVPADLGTRVLFGRALPLDYSQVCIGWDPDHVPQGDLAHGRNLLSRSADGSPPDLRALQVTFQFNALLLRTVINFGADVESHPEHALSVPPKPPHWHPLLPLCDRFEWPNKAALQSRRQSAAPPPWT